jgi:tetratricopeptide (TPR) repeat protein
MSQDQAKQSAANPLEAYEEDATPPRQTGFMGFLVPVVAVVGLGLGALFLYKGRVDVDVFVAEKLKVARDKVKKDDLKSLKEAEALYLEALEKDPSSDKAQSGAALTFFLQTQHGLETMGKAKDYLAKAEASDAQTVERFATRAYIDIVEGHPDKAERDLKALLERDIAAPKLAHALGWAQAAQGQYIDGNRILRQATETDFSAVVFRITLAQIAHQQGDEKGAVKQLNGILRPNMNENHRLAQAWEAALRLKNYGELIRPAELIEKVKGAKADIGPRTEGLLAWAEGEFHLATFHPDQALERADAALKLIPGFAPVLDLKARAFVAQGKYEDAVAAYEAALKSPVEYRGIKWDLAKLKSKRKDDAALALVDDLEKSFQGTKGPEFLIFRANHALTKGDLEQAKKLYTDAAELGDDADILLGLAKVAFMEEKDKGKKADIDKVTNAISVALDAKKSFPEAHEYVGVISLWNYLVSGANDEYGQAEAAYKKLKRPIPEVIEFYDRTIAAFEAVDGPGNVKKEAKGFVEQWKQKKGEYLQSLTAS